MKRLLAVALYAAGMWVSSPVAFAALAIVSDPTYIGFIDKGTPANETAQAGFINTLIDQAAGAGSVMIGNQYYNRQNSTLDTSAFPDAVVVSTTANCNVPGCSYTNLDVQGYTYLLGKYGTTAFVWHVAGLSTVDLPGTIKSSFTDPQTLKKQKIGGGLSHFTLYNYTAVPDGGMTLVLLSAALFGIETLRRRHIG